MIAAADFGRTGHRSTRVIFGAAALGSVTQDVADRTLEVLLEHGVNHIDTAASYGDSELRIAPWLKREPNRFFLATKTGKRDEKGAREELHRSLDRLGVDHVDLWQIHSLADPIEWDVALSPDRALEVLLEHDVNHIYVAASYGDAELRVKPWLQRHPGRFFVATKTGERRAGPAREQLHRSLDRLGVDHVDLWQLHNLVDPIDWDTALSPGGALEAALEAREQGLVRYIGITGHGTQIAATHRRSLERFDFDSVLLPCSYISMQSAYYRENFDALARTCAERRVAVQTIKSIAMRPWMEHAHTRSTWYEPFEAQEDIDLAVWWVLGREQVFLNTVGDVSLLPRVLDAAERFERAPSDAEMERLIERSCSIPLFV